MKWYGSLNNRVEENRMFCDEIKVGTGVTEYMWSDTHAYEVVEVKDQKHVYIREYDHKRKEGAPDYSNQWELISNEDNPIKYLTKRGKYWYITNTLTREELEQVEDDLHIVIGLQVNGYDLDKVKEKGKQTLYRRVNVSFGVAQYYYDYEF